MRSAHCLPEKGGGALRRETALAGLWTVVGDVETLRLSESDVDHVEGPHLERCDGREDADVRYRKFGTVRPVFDVSCYSN